MVAECIIKFTDVSVTPVVESALHVRLTRRTGHALDRYSDLDGQR
jgi:hypothetical protein